MVGLYIVSELRSEAEVGCLLLLDVANIILSLHGLCNFTGQML